MKKEAVLDTIESNKKHFKEKTRNATLNFILSVISLVGALCLLLFAVTYSVPPQIIQLQEDGSLFQKSELTVPNKTDKELKQWYVDVISKTFNYNHRNMERHPNSLTRIFSPDALASVDSFINSSNFAVLVRNRFGIVESVIGNEIELEQGQMGDRLGWMMKTKAALMVYYQGNALRAGIYEVSAIVVRESEEVNPEGLIIHSVTLKEIK
ncbi:DotI/IcmL/TraM family protein [Vibrio sp. D431a]|uniref:DotI/IcmL/TraM family protein n=1 Tax=Vibrio sp. D431a TaxID=2837388 RepID=UPI0025540BB0|nr:DotI/IcmL/TraM family protein [Vibrio sp. D431a]MDK9793831.1 DotI/IcmL/TraM family protein [Vibrio sp. D431a]